MQNQLTQFQGMHREGIGFLKGLEFQNDPMFFNANKAAFEQHVKHPLVDLCKALEPSIQRIDDTLDTRPGRTICRIRRDARYAKGVPYRTNMWISYKPVDRSNTDYFTYYFYFDTSSYGMGVGFYGTSQRVRMQAFRDRIEANPELFRRVVEESAVKLYPLTGEDYVRPPKKVDLPPYIQPWYIKKGFWVGDNRPLDDRLFTPQLLDDIVKVYFDLVPLYDFVLGRQVRFNKF